jgi:hypothetical protein
LGRLAQAGGGGGGPSLTTLGNFTDGGSLTVGSGSQLVVNGVFTETSSGTVNEQLGGSNASPTFGSVAATQGVSLAGHLTVTSSVVPAVGSSFDVLHNGSANAISGAFAGLPEGSTFPVKVGSTTMTFRITYKGGASGHDVVLTRLS